MTARDKKSKSKSVTLHPDYYTYRIIEFVSIFGADLFRAKIDLGFDMTAVIDCKLDGIKVHYNTPLVDGKMPLQLTEEWIENHDHYRLVSHGRAITGRWLVTVHSDDDILNDYLKEAGIDKPTPFRK
jgi:hypothetical protein